MKRIVYMFNLWLAALALLAFTANLHHHHHDKICFVVEECRLDGHINDQHTGHMPHQGDDTEKDNCSVETAKNFWANTNTQQRICQSLSDTLHFLCAPLLEIGSRNLTSFDQLEQPSSLLDLIFPQAFIWSETRRGPPVL